MQLRRKKPVSEGSSERWLITYADLVTLLLAFFIMMYSIATMDAEKFKKLAGSLNEAFGGAPTIIESPTSAGGALPSADQQKLQDFREVQAIIRGIMDKSGDPGSVEAVMTEEGITLVISGNLLFPSGGADLRKEGKALIDTILPVLQSLPRPMRVEGHTDNVAISNDIFSDNQELSEARAQRVASYLQFTGEISADRMTAQGFGDTKPLAPNDTPAGRAKNRRAAVVILYDQDAPTTGN